MRAVVALGRACDNACVFCGIDGLPREAVTDEGVERALVEARSSGARGVSFVGGEPGLDPRLVALVARAKALGFGQVGVQTNGRALAAEGRVAELARAGLTDVHLSLHAAEAAAHDWHTGAPGSFDAAVRTLGAARAAGLDVVVATVLTRSGFRVIGALPRFLATRGAKAWAVEVPRWRGRAAGAADRVIPRLALALPFALHALDAAEALGLPAFVRGAPACLLGRFATRALEAPELSFAPGCEACAARSLCPGVDAEYLERFGASELSACSPVSMDGRHARLREAFVGPGELAPPAARPLPPPPERARVSLPLASRPAPARAEVPASAPKRSGGDLRAILPGLFRDDEDGER